MGLAGDPLLLVEETDDLPPASFLTEAEAREIRSQPEAWGLRAAAEWAELAGAGRLDLLEVCAPENSTLTAAVQRRGGRAMRIGLHNGFDMSTSAGREFLLWLIWEGMLLLGVGPPRARPGRASEMRPVAEPLHEAVKQAALWG